MNHQAELYSLKEAATTCWRERKSSRERKNTNVNTELESTSLCVVRLLTVGKRLVMLTALL